MIIYPAIDLRKGRCVRLRQGDPNAETVFGEDPATMARQWEAAGAEWLHVVNLDGALGATQAHLGALHRPNSILIQHPGERTPENGVDELHRLLPINLKRLQEIRAAVTAPIQFGGGLRTLDDIQLALELGAERVVLGTVAVDNPQLVADAILRFGAKRIVIGLDAKDGKVATHGWQSVSTHDVVELGHQMAAMGVQLVLYTDISRDGMLSGVNVEATSRLGDITGLQVIASGGVAGIEDLERLKRHEHYGIDGVIVGQALYTGRLDLAQAIATARQPIRRRSAGLIPVRTGRHGVEFLLLFNLFFEQWQFPRGGVRPAESDMACALREFSEETGLPVGKVHEACRTELNYSVQIRNLEMRRTIVYYLAEIKVGDLRLGHDNHSEARWVTAQEAWELLSETSPEQMPALDAALAYLTEQG
jgi:phosphoribosylformimino-5-aminoimidazole carboxamide ribotide isomerase